MEVENVTIKSEYTDEDDCIIEEEIHIKEEDTQIWNDTPYKCGICGHRTTSNTLLKVHMKIHLKKRAHPCTMCNETFNLVSELNSHILTHTKEKCNFQCEVCTRDCFTEADLHKHYRVHTKEKPVKCKLCFRAFSDDAYLRIHIRSQHGEDHLASSMKKDGTYVDPSLVQNVNENKPEVSSLKPTVSKVHNKRRFKNNPNLPLNNEEKLMLVQFVAKLGINKNYSELDHLKNKLKNSWSKMIEMFAQRDYNRNAEKLARTYFHLKNHAKTHIERFYKYKKLPEPHEIDYVFVKLCPTDFDALGIDMTQVIEDSKKFSLSEIFQDACTENETDCDIVESSANGAIEMLANSCSSIEPEKRKLSSQDGPPCKISKTLEDDEHMKFEQLQIKFLMDEEKRREHLFQLELQQKTTLFEMDKKHRDEIYQKELEIKDLELKLLREKVKQCDNVD